MTTVYWNVDWEISLKRMCLFSVTDKSFLLEMALEWARSQRLLPLLLLLFSANSNICIGKSWLVPWVLLLSFAYFTYYLWGGYNYPHLQTRKWNSEHCVQAHCKWTIRIKDTVNGLLGIGMWVGQLLIQERNLAEFCKSDLRLSRKLRK